jgi:hypothetical protein
VFGGWVLCVRGGWTGLYISPLLFLDAFSLDPVLGQKEGEGWRYHSRLLFFPLFLLVFSRCIGN